MIENQQHRFIRLSTVSHTILTHVYYYRDLAGFSIDLSLTTIISGFGRRRKFDKSDFELELIEKALIRLEELNIPYYWLGIVEISGSIYSEELNQRFIQIVNSSSKKIADVFDVRYLRNNEGLIAIASEISRNQNTHSKLNPENKDLVANAIGKLHESTQNGSNILLNVDTGEARPNRSVLEVKNKATKQLKEEAIRILRSTELTESESMQLSQTYKQKLNISLQVDVYDNINRFKGLPKGAKAENHPHIEFKHVEGNSEYKVIITPASIVRENKDDKSLTSMRRYPGKPEGIVELALRKLQEIKGPSIQGTLYGVKFTVTEVMNFIRSQYKITYNWQQVKDAIEVLHKSHISIEDVSVVQQEASFSEKSSTFLPNLFWAENGDASFATFHSAIAYSIGQLSFRGWNTKTINEQKSFNHTSIIAKYLFIKWTNAAVGVPKTISMNKLLGESGLLTQNNNPNTQILNRCLKSLSSRHDEPNQKQSAILEKYEIVSIKNGRNVIDKNITLYPTAQFVKELKEISALRNIAIIDLAEQITRDVTS